MTNASSTEDRAILAIARFVCFNALVGGVLSKHLLLLVGDRKRDRRQSDARDRCATDLSRLEAPRVDAFNCCDVKRGYGLQYPSPANTSRSIDQNLKFHRPLDSSVERFRRIAGLRLVKQPWWFVGIWLRHRHALGRSHNPLTS